ncbi:hypothetical protein [Noviherbaspirillum sp. Root189]|uniref:hypothetical protein n=1 Tax=Noviherbaspirillum sp. Root189 TaxID=1736487 RepID=UPI00070A6099|nr:hypothetical protein [Noviherbaspirillum sp. Root189]KRB70500.1 hypothetical protein ASE07_07765 [Noviherbaspirillum sp. Root189]
MRKSIAITITVLAIAGCATNATVIPQTGGIYKTISYGQTQPIALNDALSGAESQCSRLKKRYEVSDQKDETIPQVPNTVLGEMLNKSGLINPPVDYRVTLTFTCV